MAAAAPAWQWRFDAQASLDLNDQHRKFTGSTTVESPATTKTWPFDEETSVMTKVDPMPPTNFKSLPKKLLVKLSGTYLSKKYAIEAVYGKQGLFAKATYP